MKKRTKKESREFRVLLGLVDLYLKTGKPVGSNTLRENGFEELSSATIRNYFGELEKQGYLKQHHSSGGRVPTPEAFRLYASESLQNPSPEPDDEEKIAKLRSAETRHLTSFLHNAIELLSEVSGYASFLSTVRFDHDFILEIKLICIDSYRLLCILITDFGQVLTETLHHDGKLSTFSLKRIENYFQWKLRGQKEEDKPINLSEEEELLAKKFYNEIMIRYLIRYSNYSAEEIFRTGFSRLLTYPEFNDPIALATGLSLFENTTQMRILLNDCLRSGTLRYWIGSDLSSYGIGNSTCAVISIPYRINQLPVGAIGLLGPCRIPYRSLFGLLHLFTDCVSEALTKSLYRYKLSYRQPRSGTPYLKQEERGIMNQTSHKLLEVKE